VINFDKSEVRNSLTPDQVFELLTEWGGEPEYTDFGILSATICHNPAGTGSRKLYWYSNTKLFQCYSNCDSFDIFELAIKVAKIQENKELDLNAAVRLIAYKFGILTYIKEEDETSLEDWEIFNRYDRIQEVELKDYNVELKEYDKSILDRLNYNVQITPWVREGMTQEVLTRAGIGFYPGGNQISIPHYDENNRFVGLRGRTLSEDDAERYGKYRPMIINKLQYSHPLGMNLYNLNNSKDNIATMGKAIVFESEKSCLLYSSYYGAENDISVACCGSNLSMYQMQKLIASGAKEVIVAFDRQFQSIGDDEFKNLTAKLVKLHNKYHNYVLMSFIFDKKKITGYKASPVDEGPEKFLQLFKDRVIL
jgi:hypothetical protein